MPSCDLVTKHLKVVITLVLSLLSRNKSDLYKDPRCAFSKLKMTIFTGVNPHLLISNGDLLRDMGYVITTAYLQCSNVKTMALLTK